MIMMHNEESQCPYCEDWYSVSIEDLNYLFQMSQAGTQFMGGCPVAVAETVHICPQCAFCVL